MKNISYNNLQFLKDIISTDYKISNYKGDAGFTTTVINDNTQNRNLNFVTEVEPFRLVYDGSDNINQTLTNGSVLRVIVDEEYGVFHMLGSQIQRSNPDSYDECKKYYQYNVNTGVLTRCLPNVRGLCFGWATSSGSNGLGGNCCLGLYKHQIHQLYRDKTNKNANIVKHYVHTGTEFIELEDAPSDITDDSGLQAIEYHNKLHLFFTDKTNYVTIHYTWDENNGYIKLPDLPFYLTLYYIYVASTAIKIYNDKLHFFLARTKDNATVHHYTWDDSNGVVEINDTILTMPNLNAEIVQKDNYFIFYYYNDYTYIWDEDNGYVQMPKLENIYGNTLSGNISSNSIYQSNIQGRFFSYKGEVYCVLGYDLSYLSAWVYGYHMNCNTTNTSVGVVFPFIFLKRHNGIWQSIKDINFRENI